MEYLKVGTELIAYEFHRSSKAKKVRITIKNERVKVTVPAGLPLEYAKNFVEENKDWVLKHWQTQQAQAKKDLPKQYVAGEKFLYRGRNYPLVVEEISAPPYEAAFKGSRIVANIPPGLNSQEQSLLLKKLIKKWYLGQANKLLPELLDYYSKLMDIPYQKLKVKDQKTRWGSCSSKGNINLNWRIIMAPNPVTAYVIIHELAHLKIMDHSKEFWTLVAKYLPDYKQCKKWLTENGKELLSYF
ncbi:MAG TPA: M48 family metallopeptidase [Peptococcaceae bacterium]|nr:M48 family metallopeptidase [Peptococcaceae bacterium]